uniref:Uncharacterized protein n=1 Tax=Setaria italica TaxID=4555 RepID=K3Y167_SETIT
QWPEQSLHMNRGERESSYARNSITQAVTRLWKYTKTLRKVVITDLGCASGPNTLTLVETAVEVIFRHCMDKEELPEISVFLNDLPDNDSNNLLLLFYKRLFTSKSVNLVLSSNSLNLLSEVPDDLKKNRIPMYESDEGLRRARRPFVDQACGRQFRKDFTTFLKTRAQELVSMGQMVLCMVGRPSSDNDYLYIQPWDAPFIPLNDMASRGVISTEMLDSFYVLMNTPRIRALAARAAFEPTIKQHFGHSEEVMDEVVRTIERQLSETSPHVSAAPADSLLFLCVSVTKKD